MTALQDRSSATGNSGDALVRFTQVKKSYDGIQYVVKDLNLDVAKGEFLTRDLINTPACDMGPDELEAATRTLADAFGAAFSVTTGAALTPGSACPTVLSSRVARSSACALASVIFSCTPAQPASSTPAASKA